MNAAILTVSEDIRLPGLADEAKVLALELGGLEVETSLLEGELCIDVTAADIMAHDLSSLHLGTSDTILMRWSEGKLILNSKMVESVSRLSQACKANPYPAICPTVRQPCCILCSCPSTC